MAGTTNIEWTETTWNPIVGCSLASPGCTNCYAMKMAGRVEATGHPAYQGLTKRAKTGFVWTGKLAMNEKALLEPLRWKKPRMVFVNSMGDLFHEDCTEEMIDRIFAVMALCPQHTFQVLTKRSDRMKEYCKGLTVIDGMRRIERQIVAAGGDASETEEFLMVIGENGCLRNVWLGVSVEDQQRADERIPDLLATPAAVRWISAEPLLGLVDLTAIKGRYWQFSALDDRDWIALSGAGREQMPKGEHTLLMPRLDWVVAGGESGAGARPMHPDWARSLRDQCAAASVPFFFKQWGEWAPGVSIEGHVTRTEKTADWFNDRWSFEEITPRMAEELHTDDEPLLWRCGKKRAGRLLDGVLHDGMPGGDA